MPLFKKKNNKTEKSTDQAQKSITAPKLIVFMMVAVLLGGGIMLGFLNFTGYLDRDDSEEVEDKSKHVVKETLDLGSMVINLADPGGSRYVKVRAIFEYPKEKKMNEEVKKKEHQITESVLITFRSKTMAEIQPLSKLETVKGELLKNANAHLETGQFEDVYFIEFIIH